MHFMAVGVSSVMQSSDLRHPREDITCLQYVVSVWKQFVVANY